MSAIPKRSAYSPNIQITDASASAHPVHPDPRKGLQRYFRILVWILAKSILDRNNSLLHYIVDLGSDYPQQHIDAHFGSSLSFITKRPIARRNSAQIPYLLQ